MHSATRGSVLVICDACRSVSGSPPVSNATALASARRRRSRQRSVRVSEVSPDPESPEDSQVDAWAAIHSAAYASSRGITARAAADPNDGDRAVAAASMRSACATLQTSARSSDPCSQAGGFVPNWPQAMPRTPPPTATPVSAYQRRRLHLCPRSSAATSASMLGHLRAGSTAKPRARDRLSQRGTRREPCRNGAARSGSRASSGSVARE